MSAFEDPKTLYFFFDYISHNAYLAWTQIHVLVRRHGLTLEPVPVLFAGLLSHYKQIGPAEIPAKSRWMLRNVLRKAQRLNVPIAPPASHPFNPLLPLRLSCCELAPAQRIDLVTRLFRATWAESIPVSEAAALKPLLADAGLPADALIEQAQSDTVKAQLRANTETALAAGVFGVPGMMVRGELFWGFDDLPYLEEFLAGRDRILADVDPRWKAVKPSAERRR